MRHDKVDTENNPIRPLPGDLKARGKMEAFGYAVQFAAMYSGDDAAKFDTAIREKIAQIRDDAPDTALHLTKYMGWYSLRGPAL